MSRVEEVMKEVIAQDVEPLLSKMAVHLHGFAHRRAKQNRSIDTGFLLRASNIVVHPLERIIVFPAPYTSAIEFGTRPHHPPVAPLIRYAKRKLGLNEKEANRVGWGIARKIAREGSEPKPFIRPAIADTIRKFGK